QGSVRHLLLLDLVRLVHLLHAELSHGSGQLYPRQSRRDAGAYRARMVLPAILRDASQYSEQARRRGRDVLLDPDTGVPAMARYCQDQVIQISSAGQAVLLDLRRRRGAAWLARWQAA